MSIGTIELYIIILFFFTAVTGSYLLKKQKSDRFKFFTLLLFGITGVFLLAAILTPPDLISNFIISLPGIIIYSIIVSLKLKK